MRIAVTGTHRVGKTTLAEAIADAVPRLDLVDEPYHDMVAEGHVFSHPPTPEDFEAQLEHSLVEMSEDRDDVIFDRCPIDLLAYLLTSAPDPLVVLERWHGRVRRGMRSLNLVVLVPIEDPDRIGFAEPDDAVLDRQAVDDQIRELVLKDGLDVDVDILEVRGSPQERMDMVLRRLAEVFGLGPSG